jgi:pimeloyl-ACP methyl ester carboxylesterase
MTSQRSGQAGAPSGPRAAEPLFGRLWGRRNQPRIDPPTDYPLIVAVHGGTYSSAYFDLPGYSLLSRAEALGVPVLALDRPGYGHSPPLPEGEDTFRGNADILASELKGAWKAYGEAARGVFLIGHSIGAAIAMMIAARERDWPLLGLAVSGVGLRTPDHSGDAWSALPKSRFVDIPGEVKDEAMFGPDGSFTSDMPRASHSADAPVPRTELMQIVTSWRDEVADVAARIKVPVHYRQAEFDRLWIVDEAEVEGFAAALSSSAHVDAAIWRAAGHCIDFHRAGPALQIQQLGWALQCAAEAGAATAAHGRLAFATG